MKLKWRKKITFTFLLSLVIFIVFVIPIAAAEEVTAVQTSDYTFIINAILLIIASVAFILIRIKRGNKK
jgi:hypothetical protein